jgi:hypothetical protein
MVAIDDESMLKPEASKKPLAVTGGYCGAVDKR